MHTREAQTPHVLSIGAWSSDSVVRALSVALTDEPSRVDVLTPEHVHDLIYTRADTELTQVLDSFQTGNTPSVRLEWRNGDVARALLFTPCFAGDANPWWAVLVEVRSGNPLALFEIVCETPELAFAALHVEDALSEIPVPLDSSAFHWDDPWLVSAAIWEPGAELVMRRGAAFREVPPGQQDAAAK
jgi:hypothetical protein